MDQAAARAQCDLVMKGGITSGVVYPQLISELAAKYQFKNIGGTSAGAIAAAGCAAAEYGRQHGNASSFAQLGELPRQLGDPAPGATDGQSMLFHLFQPAATVRKHFNVLVSMLNAAPLAAVGSALRAMVRQFWPGALLGFFLALIMFAPVVLMVSPRLGDERALVVAVVVLLAWAAWASVGLRQLQRLATQGLRAALIWWAIGIAGTFVALGLLTGVPFDLRLLVGAVAGGIAAPLVIALVIALAGRSFVNSLLAGVHGNLYGLCSGRTEAAPGGPQGLTDWLTGYFNQLAGLPPEEPLTFGHLWTGRRPMPGEAIDETAPRGINLEVMTTAVSQQMCYAIPFRAEAEHLYFDPAEWARLFPREVMQWIEQASAADTRARFAAVEEEQKSQLRVLRAVARDGRELMRLPANSHLPVVVAVRMSLSFPVLLSAVPLYAIDFSLSENQSPPTPGTYTATKVWFSDGGIASNMPLHFFDAALPKHPTFAVNLKTPHPKFPVQKGVRAAQQQGRVYLPTSNAAGRLRFWEEPDDHAPLPGLLGLLKGIVGTMQNWRDEIQFPYPGYRDRIVQISQLPDEGGMNLNMPKENIDALSDAGQHAAHCFIARFHPEGGGEGWRNHQAVRLSSFLGVLERLALGLAPRLADDTWPAVVQQLVASKRYDQASAEAAVDCLRRLHELGVALKASNAGLEERALNPRPTLRIAPRI